MSLLDGVRHRLYVLWRGEAYAGEVERETRFHLELEKLSLSRDGLAHRDLELAARRTFGNVSYYREEARAMTPLLWLDRLRQDASYALRGLARAPGFTATVVTTLALGVGLNAAMFSLLDRVFVKPPAGVAAPSELRRLYIDDPHTTYDDSHVFPRFSYASYQAVRDAFQEVETAAFTPADSVRPNDGGPLLHRSFVSGNYFHVLGVRALVGRLFDEAEARIDMPTPVMIISERLWRDEFGGDRSIIGRRVKTGLIEFTIIGVVADPFAGVELSAADAWAPLNSFGGGRLSLIDASWFRTSSPLLRVIARVNRTSGESQLIARGTAALRNARAADGALPLSEARLAIGSIVAARGPTKNESEVSMSVRLGAVAVIVLLISCANVGNLLLMRANRRRREIAVRRALGVSRWRLYEQVIAESLLLAFLGGAAALVVGGWGGALMRKLLFPSINWAGGAIDLRAVGFVAVASIVVGTLVGLAPAFAGSRVDIISSLRAGSLEGAYRRSALSSSLLVAQTALSIVLLIGAGLFVRSLVNVQSIDLGFDTPELLFANVGVTAQQRFGPEAQPAFERVEVAIRRVPGVESTALSNTGPMGGYSGTRIFRPNGDSLAHSDELPTYVSVSPDYFATVGLRLRRGRLFTDADRAGSAPVMIVNERMANQLWPGESAVGQCLVLAKVGNPCVQVVGVVDDAHRMQIVEAPASQYYRPLSQRSSYSAPVLIVRARHDRMRLVVAEVRHQMKLAFPEAEVIQVRTVEQMLDRELHPWRLGAQLFSMFGILALLVAAIGVYSIVAYGVSRRTHEMGIRVALGAEVIDILRLVVVEGMVIVGLGIAVGIAGAFALGRFVAALLYGITPHDPMTMAIATLVLATCAVVACLIPAGRASRVDPVQALRAE